MDSKQIMLRGYMSHCIRGKKGSTCSPQELEANCARATQDGGQLMALFQRWGLPVFLYVPGAHDEFTQKAWKAGRITETEVLDTDCDIVRECDFLLVYNWQNYISGGMQYEINYAKEQLIPIITLKEIDQRSLWSLQISLIDLLLDKLDQPTIIQIHGDIK